MRCDFRKKYVDKLIFFFSNENVLKRYFRLVEIINLQHTYLKKCLLSIL